MTAEFSEAQSVTRTIFEIEFSFQVYRGPSDGKGYDVFAPWGFYMAHRDLTNGASFLIY